MLIVLTVWRQSAMHAPPRFLLIASLMMALLARGQVTMCSTDADCLPASCCHATTCVHKTAVPATRSCSEQCQCVPFTLDCGGTCGCNSDHVCEAHVVSGPLLAAHAKPRKYGYTHVKAPKGSKGNKG